MTCRNLAFEIARDLLDAGAGSPDHVFVPAGDGVILAGVYRGFENLLKLGRIQKMPVLWACQAEGSSAIARMGIPLFRQRRFWTLSNRRIGSVWTSSPRHAASDWKYEDIP